MNLLFVCSGNICRSPMAAEYCRHRAVARGLRWLAVQSAGTLGIEDRAAPEPARVAMAEIGVDLSRHRSKGLRFEHVLAADYTIVMEREHLSYLGRCHPDGTDTRMLLRSFETGPDPHPYPLELDDPIGFGIEVYRELVPIIVRSVDHLLEFLEERR